MLAQVRTPSGATCKGVLSIGTRTRVFGIRHPGSSAGGDTCFSLQQKLLRVGGRSCKWLQKKSLPRLALPNINLQLISSLQFNIVSHYSYLAIHPLYCY